MLPRGLRKSREVTADPGANATFGRTECPGATGIAGSAAGSGVFLCARAANADRDCWFKVQSCGGNRFPAAGAEPVVALLETIQGPLDIFKVLLAPMFHLRRHGLALHGIHPRQSADS